MPTPKPGAAADRRTSLHPMRRAEGHLSIPEAPYELDPVAQATWDLLAPELHATGLLKDLDVIVFATLCELVSFARAARDVLVRGLLIKGRRDGVVTNPAWRIYRDATDRIRVLGHEFGLTPAARLLLQRIVSGTSISEAGDEVDESSG